MPNFIDGLEKKKKEGYYDWKETDNPIQDAGAQTSTVMIPEHGNHPVFENGGEVLRPSGKSSTPKSSGKKTYFF